MSGLWREARHIAVARRMEEARRRIMETRMHLGRPSRRLAVLLALVLPLSACSYVPTRSVDYTPIPVAGPAAPAGSLVVQQLEDGRPPREYHSMMARAFLTYVPLIPFVRVPYERLDDVDVQHQSAKSNPTGSEKLFTRLFARAIADDLRSAGFFREVVYDPDAGVPSSDYVLTGELHSTLFEQTATSYMLGMAGVLLWILPIPMAAQTGNVAIDLDLRDQSGATVWTYRILGEETRWYTMYNSGGAPVTSRYSLEIKRYGSNDEGIDEDSLWAYYAAALRRGMAGAKESLAAFLDGQAQR